MTSRLDDAIARTQDTPLAWNAARAARIRANILGHRESQVHRRRFMHRAFVLAGACTLLVVASLRAASTPPTPPPSAPAVSSQMTAAHTSAMAQADRLDDAGYARD